MQTVQQIVAAIIRQEEKILLVQHPDAGFFVSGWYLPAAAQRPGETLEMTLHRTVREQTDFTMSADGTLVQVVRLVTRSDGSETRIYLFEIGNCARKTDHANGQRLSGHFLSASEAALSLDQALRIAVREPARAYLSGEVGPGFVWLYQVIEGGEQLIARLPSTAI